VWHMDKEQWHLLWPGEQDFWKTVQRLLASGHCTAEGLTEPYDHLRRSSVGQPYKIPRLMAAQDGECTQTMRILLSRGIAGIDERTRGLAQRWFDTWLTGDQRTWVAPNWELVCEASKATRRSWKVK
jgi:hypothetical protein